MASTTDSTRAAATQGEAEVRWLDDGQQRAWRAYLEGTARFVAALDRAHDSGSPLSLGEYHLLVQLSEQPGRTLRMSALADGLALSRSRLTHTVDRMERRGLVERQAVPGDRRGVNCVMTEAGWELLVRSAPLHVAAVRRLMVDVLEPEEFEVLGRAMGKVAREAKTYEA
ncbi:MarR family transcriptional regulator [Xylanimonas oleitrophica]|uniref:MarR family transcriptional regulator n=1 Tax=Xylanimonas oleitrophica TaxID=2607479 RepID=A0A2W5WMD4_9MICO|nr:MarR family transcriptional regulator [Xylanimonas oleitrophica]PZR51883.1 MarR family transcriptional regulator [Xylanimonas oleitrophica]